MERVIQCMYDYSCSSIIEDQEVSTTPEWYFRDPRYYGAYLDPNVIRVSKEAIYFDDGTSYHRVLGWRHPRKSASMRRRLMRSKKR